MLEEQDYEQETSFKEIGPLVYDPLVKSGRFW
jgi:hypothetical protein